MKKITLGLFLIALAVRLYVLFFVTNPQNAGVGWYTDTYHHWQIGYLTKTIGLHQEPWRLWDLKGMEYFWGMGHPLLLVLLFSLTGSADILVTRLLTVVLGALFVSLLYSVVKRHWGQDIALAAAAWALLAPIPVFTDVSGLQMSVGLFFLMLGFYFWPKKVWLTALAWALAGTMRTEFWLVAAALVTAALFLEKSFDRKLLLGFGYLIFTGLYLKLLADKTGNAVYPLYWNFRANIAGEWVSKTPGLWVATPLVTAVWWLMRSAALALTGVLVWLWRRAKGEWRLFVSWGVINLIAIALVLSSAYAFNSFEIALWIGQLWSWPMIFIGLLLAVWLFKRLPRRLAWLAMAALFIGSSLGLWPPILKRYHRHDSDWQMKIREAGLVKEYYRGGALLLPSDRPDLTYTLVRYAGISGENIRGNMFGPFYYLPADPWTGWGQNRSKVLDWFKSEDIKLMIVYPQTPYEELAKREPAHFRFLIQEEAIQLYAVNL